MKMLSKVGYLVKLKQDKKNFNIFILQVRRYQ
jgi:hypothetical protein